MNEKEIQKIMKKLNISREEAIQLIKDDIEIDRMTSSKQIDSDLTDEQRKAKKKASQADRKKTVYKFDTTKRKKKENSSKRELIAVLRSALEKNGCSDIEVTHVEREIIFYFDEVKYKLALSCPRT